MVTSPTYNSSPPSQPVFIHTVWSHPPPTTLLHHYIQSSYTLYGHIPHLQLFSTITTSLHTHCMVTSPTYNSSPPLQPVFIHTVWSHPPPTTLLHYHNQSSYTLYGHIPHLQLFSTITTSLHTHCMVTSPIYNSSPPSQPVFIHTVWSHPPPTHLLHHYNQSSYKLYGHIPHLQLFSTISTSLHTHCMVTSPTYNSSPPSQPVFIHTVWSHPPPTTLLHHHNQSSYTLYGHIPHLQLFSTITTSLHTHCMVTSPTYNSSPPSQPVFIHTVWSHPPPTPFIFHEDTVLSEGLAAKTTGSQLTVLNESKPHYIIQCLHRIHRVHSVSTVRQQCMQCVDYLLLALSLGSHKHTVNVSSACSHDERAHGMLLTGLPIITTTPTEMAPAWRSAACLKGSRRTAFLSPRRVLSSRRPCLYSRLSRPCTASRQPVQSRHTHRPTDRTQ